MANTKIFIFDEDITYLQRTKLMRTEKIRGEHRLFG